MIILLPLLSGIFFTAKFAIETNKKVMVVKGLMGKLQTRGIMAYPPPPRTVELTSEEVNDGLDLLCGPGKIALRTNPLPCQFFRNFKIDFLPSKFIASAHLLKPLDAEITVDGRILLVNEKSLEVKFDKVDLDGKSAPPETVVQLEKTTQQEIDNALKQIKSLALENVTISQGKIAFSGIFSFDELLCSFGLKDYCSSNSKTF